MSVIYFFGNQKIRPRPSKPKLTKKTKDLNEPKNLSHHTQKDFEDQKLNANIGYSIRDFYMKRKVAVVEEEAEGEGDAEELHRSDSEQEELEEGRRINYL